MEKLGAIIKAQQSEGSTADLTTSARSLKPAEITQLDQMLAGMVAYYPHQEIPHETMIQYREEFKLMAVKHGLASLRDAWLTIRRRAGQTFFPHPSQVQEELDAMAKKQKQEQMQALPPLGCEECKEGVGFAPGLVIRVENGVNQVRFCRCRIARNRAKAGVPPAPTEQGVQHDSKAKAAGE